MAKEVLITADELIALENDDIALQLFYIVIKHGRKSTNDAIEIGRMIENHGHAFKKRLAEREKVTQNE